ncbi:HAD family hydrolase [Neobacillus sp. OS1-33]|jgi:Cof subfamily protein (haloacid dehalogenase superfamily)|uniref:HAD family hydrolase n=1 Tax=Neobacillus sp. OS1-33 TaxID=3070683 RepID=UPI0027DF9D71|nr:HAD family hydrolase [Neobacillus sp. OS1-33]WML26026.1 HAD family hydrolase [Neobacillus sp. OS1-33]
MTNYKVLFLDIDGTLVRPDDTIEDSTKEAISQVQARGIEVFLATGRPLHELKELAKELNIHSFIGYNGAYAIYKGEDLFQEPMKSSTVQSFLEIAKDNKHEVVLYTNSKNVFTNLTSEIITEFMQKFHLHKNEAYSPSIKHTVLGMTLVNLKKEDPALYNKEDGIHLSQINVEGMRHCYDVIRDSVNKGYGIQVVLKRLGINKESSIAFGDGMNDKEMLQQVGESFAMGNGHSDLFQYAKHKTTEVTDSGIYNGLKMLGLVK